MKTNSISFSGLLFIVFLVLKLTNVITWSWWWVTCPLWAPAGLCILWILIICIIGIICGADIAGAFKDGWNSAIDKYLSEKK